MESGETPTKDIITRAFPTAASIKKAIAQFNGEDNDLHYLRFGRSGEKTTGKIPIISEFLMRPGKRSMKGFLTRPTRKGQVSDFLTRPGKRNVRSDYFLVRPTRNDEGLDRIIRQDWSNFLSRPTKRGSMASFLSRPTRSDSMAHFLSRPTKRDQISNFWTRPNRGGVSSFLTRPGRSQENFMEIPSFETDYLFYEDKED
ncbi:hypothetical protein TCAL_14974 [Tigriopus californicus]|uniref:Uncharacterized protein n=2 Tax=Tigriopus californicus TaxID=6832 RepID=A0A553N8F0_TIGCA|nr:hypothetical protein TCAL_14974 [Tigriopus californicus]